MKVIDDLIVLFMRGIAGKKKLVVNFLDNFDGGVDSFLKTIKFSESRFVQMTSFFKTFRYFCELPSGLFVIFQALF